MVFQTNRSSLAFFQIIIDKKVNNLNIFTVIISKEKIIASLISLKINYLLFILEGNLNLF